VSRLASLLRAGLRSNFGLSIALHRLFVEKKDRWYIPLFGLAALGVLPTLYGYVLLIRSLFGFLQPMGQERLLLAYGILFGQFLVLLFGFYYVVAAFYFSRDLDMLIPLPFRPVEVMLSKFAVILVNEYLTMLPLILPLFVAYGVLSKARFSYWAGAVVVYALLPVIPLAIVSILSVGMMRLVNLSRKKDVLIVVGSIVLIVAAMGLQFTVGKSAGRGLGPEAIAGFFTSPDSLLARIGAGFPPSVWATKALAESGAPSGRTSLFVFAAVSFLFFWGIVIAADKLFYRGLIGIGEISGRRRALSKAELSRRVSSGRRPIRAIFTREWRIMNRTPIFLLNGVLTAVLVPLIFVVMSKMDPGRGDTAVMLNFLTSSTSVYLILGAAVFMIVSGCLNGTASSAFSREGGQFWMSKVIPVAPREQVLAKFAHSYLVTLLGIGAAATVLVFVMHISASACLAAILLALTAGVGLTAVGMIIDLARPLLDWINPMKAIKQNLNVLIAFFADMGILAVVWGITTLMRKAGIGGSSLVAAVFMVLAVISILCFRFLLAFADKRYLEIEV
jgi:ABC-2 type transport system permease protein